MSEKELEKILKALANRRRIMILRLLKKHKEMAVGDIASEIKLSFTATSKHLSILKNAGISDSEQRSLQMLYSLVSNPSEPARRIIALL